jgi:hypothetical protein
MLLLVNAAPEPAQGSPLSPIPYCLLKLRQRRMANTTGSGLPLYCSGLKAGQSDQKNQKYPRHPLVEIRQTDGIHAKLTILFFFIDVLYKLLII